MPKVPENDSWDEVIKQCEQLLTERSKDVRLVAMLAVAISFRHGIAGIRDAFAFLSEFVGRYGGAMHPGPARKAYKSLPAVPRLVAAAARVAPLTNEPESQICLLRQEVAVYLDGNPKDLSPDVAVRFRDMEISRAAVDKALKATPAEYTRDLLQTVDEATANVEAAQQAISNWLKDTLDKDYISHEFKDFGELRQTLLACRRLVASVVTDSEPKPSPPDPPSKAAAARVSELPGERPATRQQAIRGLELIRQYFVDNERHSPLPFLLDRVIHWAELPLPEVLKELLGDQSGAVKVLSERANIRLANPNDTTAKPSDVSRKRHWTNRPDLPRKPAMNRRIKQTFSVEERNSKKRTWGVSCELGA